MSGEYSAYRHPLEWEQCHVSFGCQTTGIVATAKATGGACAIWMHVAQSGFSPPRHIWCDGATFTVSPGDTATLPHGLPHSFRVTGRGPARMMVTVVPGGFERFCAEVAAMRLPSDIPDLIDISETLASVTRGVHCLTEAGAGEA